MVLQISVFSCNLTIICISALWFIDGMFGGYAIAFVSFFFAIVGVAVAALFFRHAQVMDSS